MSSSVEREDEGRGATDFFRMGLGRLQERTEICEGLSNSPVRLKGNPEVGERPGLCQRSLTFTGGFQRA